MNRSWRWTTFCCLFVSLFTLSTRRVAAQQKSKPPSTSAPSHQSPAGRQADDAEQPFIVEHYMTQVRFENNGTGQRDLEVKVLVQSQAGVQQLGQLAFGYNSASEQLDIATVEVHKPDGTVTHATPADVQDMTATIARNAPVYTDYREKHITVPGLGPGDTLIYHIITRMNTPLAPGEFWFEYSFLKDVTVLDEELEINLPLRRAVKLKTRPDAEPVVSEEAGRKIYRWKHSHHEIRAGDSTAPRKSPSKEDLKPSVQLTTFASWEEVGRWYASLERPQAAPTEPVRAKARELTKDHTTDLGKIEALYDFVATNYRYVSLSFGLGRYQPHPAGEVLSNQYGDCKDKHTLLESLVEAVGLRAYPALMSSTREIDPDVPSPAQFDHVITAVPLGQEWIWLDTTTEVAPFRLLAARLRDKQALLIPISPEPGVSAEPARLMRTPADPPFLSTQDIAIIGKISGLGKLTAHVRYILRGDTELLLRAAFRATPQSKWEALGQLLATSDGFQGKVTEIKLSDPAATHDPFSVEFEIEQPNYLDWSRQHAQLDLPLPHFSLPAAEEADEGKDAPPEPLKLGAPLEATLRLELELPARYGARAPIAVAVMRDYAEYHSRYKMEAGKLVAQRTIQFRNREVPRERLQDYLAFSNAVRADEEQSLALDAAATGTPEIPAGASTDELYEAGTAALRQGNFRGAVKLLEHVVAQDPKHKSAWNDLGQAYLGIGQLEDAAKALRHQIELNPYDAYAYNNLGRVLWVQRKYDEAVKAFHEQLEVNPLDRFAHANLGLLFLQRHDYAQAAPELEKAIAISPDNPSLQASLGQAYLYLDENDKGLAALNKAVELAPSPLIWNNVAYELAQHGVDLGRARQYAETAVSDTAARLRNVSLDHLTLLDLQQTQALASYWDTLGWVFFKQGDLDRAEPFIEAAWQLSQHGEVADHLAQLYEKRGWKEKAIHSFALALAVPDRTPETRKRMAALAGGDERVDSLVEKFREEPSRQRTNSLGKLLKEGAKAEFFLLFAPAPMETDARKPGSPVPAKVMDVKFISGSESLRLMTDALRSVRYAVSFPDNTSTRLVRRGILSCSAETRNCVIVLMLPQDVRTVD